MKKILLRNKNKYVMVDDEDFEWLNQYIWSLNSDGYAVRRGKINDGIKRGKTIRMHSEILNTPKGMMTDHKDRNRLNNQRSNLRICTAQENSINRTLNKKPTSNYHGVCKRYRKWQARIEINNKKLHLGCFENIKEAALAYNKAALKYHGEFARLNQI